MVLAGLFALGLWMWTIYHGLVHGYRADRGDALYGGSVMSAIGLVLGGFGLRWLVHAMRRRR